MPIWFFLVELPTAAQVSCKICRKDILISSPEFHELCIACWNEFNEMMLAVAELSVEMANAYGQTQEEHALRDVQPGIPIEEIVMRMELNRIRNKVARMP